MPGKTVFISSRMDELAFERRSAFEATYLRGLTPLLFETEPADGDEKRMIDNLVDRASIFVGIYYQTIGQASEELHGMEPIAYELYRFLFRFSDERIKIETNHENRCNGRVRSRLDKLLGPDGSGDGLSSHILQLRDRIESGDQQLHDILRNRVRLFVKTHNYDTSMSVNLARMLRIFPRIEEFCSRREELAETINTDKQPQYQYVAARVDLFDKIHQQVTAAERNGFKAWRDPSASEEPKHYWRIEGSDQPGVLFHVLRSFLDEGFNIDLVCSGKPLDVSQANQGKVIIDIVAHPFLGSTVQQTSPASRDEADKQIMSLEHRIKDTLKTTAGLEVSMHHEFLSDWNSWQHVPRARKNKSTTRLFYTVETADVPGQILRLAQKVYHYEGNVDLLYYDSRSNLLNRRAGNYAKYTEIQLVISVPESSELISDSIHRSRFETEVRQGLGVVGIRKLKDSRFFDRLQQIEEMTEASVADCA